MPRGSPRLRDRSTGDLLVLMIAGTVCVIILGSTLSIILAGVFRPNQDTGSAAAAVGDVVNTLIGLLAGFLAGRSETTLRDTPAKREGKQEGP